MATHSRMPKINLERLANTRTSYSQSFSLPQLKKNSYPTMDICFIDNFEIPFYNGVSIIAGVFYSYFSYLGSSPLVNQISPRAHVAKFS